MVFMIFLYVIFFNFLITEIRALAKGARLKLPLVEEIAADIFMGEFSGKFLAAADDKASDENERQSFRIETAQGEVFGLVQIAGLIARRIVRLVEQGEVVEAGERVGLIRFGSRCDVYLPDGMEPLVAVGQRAIAGETVLADGRRNATVDDWRRS